MTYILFVSLFILPNSCFQKCFPFLSLLIQFPHFYNPSHIFNNYILNYPFLSYFIKSFYRCLSYSRLLYILNNIFFKSFVSLSIPFPIIQHFLTRFLLVFFHLFLLLSIPMYSFKLTLLEFEFFIPFKFF